MLSSIAQFRLLIFYLQGLFNAHKKFPRQITQNMTQGHLATYRSSGLVCLQSAIKMQSLLTLTNTISIPQNKKKHCFFYSPIQTRILLKHRSCCTGCVCASQTAFWPQNPVAHLGGRARADCAPKTGWSTQTRKELSKQLLCAFIVITRKNWHRSVCFRGGVKRIREEIRCRDVAYPMFHRKNFSATL